MMTVFNICRIKGYVIKRFVRKSRVGVHPLLDTLHFKSDFMNKTFASWACFPRNKGFSLLKKEKEPPMVNSEVGSIVNQC